MANMEEQIRSYEDARDFLDGADSRKLGHNTYVERMADPGMIGVRLHKTYVVVYHEDGRIRLNSGGWQTVTTQDRINQCSPFRVGSDGDGGWDVTSRTDGARFSNFMVSDPDGQGWQEHKALVFKSR